MTAIPIIPGFHPDPSICRVGDDYYIANSSFEYAPGVPISHSRDLVTWTLVGNALTRPSQLTPSAGAASAGIYAPTLRHHDGRFYLITTNVAEVSRGHLIVSADDPAGPWSEPVHTRGTVGIDPDLSWDENGICHLTWASFHPALQGIASVPVNPATGELLGEPRLLWPGTGLSHPEGPHLYRIGDWWYLLLAEGGTERGHAVTIARARTLDGEWEAAPANPLLTHRSLDLPVQNTGHADLVECADGSWAMVYLGVRPLGQTPKFHLNGRETFIAGVDWAHGWPVVDETRFSPAVADRSFSDDFSGTLHPRWIAPGAGAERFASSAGASGLDLQADADDVAPRLLACRAEDLDWTAEVHLDASAGAARFQVRLDADHLYGLTVRGSEIQPVLRIGPSESALVALTIDEGEAVALRLRARVPQGDPYRLDPAPDRIELTVVRADGTEHSWGGFDGRYLSTEVAGGFTGRVIGVEVLDGRVRLERFTYDSIITEGTSAS